MPVSIQMLLVLLVLFAVTMRPVFLIGLGLVGAVVVITSIKRLWP